MKYHTDFITSMILFRIKDDPEKEFLISAGSDKRMILWKWQNDESKITESSNEGAAPSNN